MPITFPNLSITGGYAACLGYSKSIMAQISFPREMHLQFTAIGIERVRYRLSRARVIIICSQ